MNIMGDLKKFGLESSTLFKLSNLYRAKLYVWKSRVAASF